MGANDNFQFGRTQPLGKVSFGDSTYSDQFVRAPTAELSVPKKKTSPLALTGDLVEQMRTQADNQLRTCEAILDKFSQRMRILQWADDAARHKGAAKTPPPAPPPEPEPKKKGLLGKKLSPTKPAKAKASAIPGPKPDRPRSLVLLSAQEQAIGVVVARIIEGSVEVQRQVQIALFQYNEALSAVQTAQAGLAKAQELDIQRAFDLIERLEVAKVQGKIYPLTNFHEVFKAHPQISRLFPPPMPRQ